MSAPRKPNHLIQHLPLADYGWRELAVFGLPLLVATVAVGWPGPPWCWAAAIPALLLLLLLWFFRDPPRTVPDDPNAFLSPADGRIVEIASVDWYDFFDGPATRIGIYLSIFNAHINRAPRTARVVATDYSEGQFLDARNPASAAENEYMWLGFEEPSGAKHAVRQIAGKVARRIVCVVWPGDEVRAGEKFGMIKFGSRTELIVPAGTQVTCAVGDRVKAGVSVLARSDDDGRP